MRRILKGNGIVLYEKEEADYLAEDLERSARLYAQSFEDPVAARMPNLFPTWEAGIQYAAGDRLTDGKGRLYKVLQRHVSQTDWPLAGTAALYQPLDGAAGRLG